MKNSFDLRSILLRAVIVVALIGMVGFFIGRVFFPDALGFLWKDLGDHPWIGVIILGIITLYWAVALLRLLLR